MAVHNADPAFWTFELGLPEKVKGDTYGDGPVTIAYPKKSRIEMSFAPNKWIPNGVRLTWFDGGLKPDMASIPGLAEFAAKYGVQEEKRQAEKARKAGKPYSPPATVAPLVPGNGLIIVGTKATTIGESHAKKPSCIAGDKAAFAAALAKGEEAARYSHYREFVAACLAGAPEKCGSKLSYAAPLTEALLIGCIALRYPGEELAFDTKRLRFADKVDANRFLKAPKRGAWNFASLVGRRA